MNYCIAALLIFIASPAFGQNAGGSIVFESSVEVTLSKRVEHEQSTQSAAYHFSSTIPNELAGLVQKYTDIECTEVGANTLVPDEAGAFGRSLAMLGDSLTEKADTKIGKLVRKRDNSYIFKRVFEVSGKNSFVAEGAFEFKNNLIDKKCYIICRIKGQRDEKGVVTGKSEWIGPIILENITTTMALPTIFEEKQSPQK